MYSDTMTLYLPMWLKWLVCVYEKRTGSSLPSGMKSSLQVTDPTFSSISSFLFESLYVWFIGRRDWLFLRGRQWPTLPKCSWVLCKTSVSQGFTWFNSHHWGETTPEGHINVAVIGFIFFLQLTFPD